MNLFQKNAKAVVLVACLAASTAPIFIRMSGEMPALAIGFYRLLIAMPVFLFPVLTTHRDKLRAVTTPRLWYCVLSGFFLFLHFFTWNLSIAKTTIASASVISSLHPIIIVVLSALFFQEKTRGKVIIGVVLALIGSAIITGGDYSFSKEALFGDFLAFLAGFFMALYLMAGRRLRPHIHSTVYMFLVFGSALVFFAIAMVGTGDAFVGYATSTWLSILALGIINQIFVHGVFNWSLGYVSPLYVSTSQTGIVVFAAIMAFFLFAEIPTLWQYIGGIVTIAGIVWYNYYESRPGAPNRKAR